MAVREGETCGVVTCGVNDTEIHGGLFSALM